MEKGRIVLAALLKKIRRDWKNEINDLISNTSIQYTIMAIVASGINFLTLIIWGRIFSPEDYAIATTFQAFVANVSIFMIPLQIMVCSLLAGNSGDKKIENIISMSGLISIIELTVLIMAIEKVMQYLCFQGVIEAVLFIVIILSNNIYVLLAGLAQGEQDFLLLGKANIVLYFVKLLLSVALNFAGAGRLAVIIGFVIANLVCVAMMTKKLLEQIKIPSKIYKVQFDKDMLKQYVWMFVLYVGVSVYMNNGDLLLGNLYCSKEEIGLYSAVIGLAKISVFLIATPIATIAFPKMVAAKEERKMQNKTLILAEIITFVGSFLYGICFYIGGGWLIPLIYGKAYREAAAYRLPCVIFSIVLGMFWIFYQYVLAAELTRKFAVATAVTGIIAIVWILKMKIELSIIPVVMAIAMILTMIILAISLKENINN